MRPPKTPPAAPKRRQPAARPAGTGSTDPDALAGLPPMPKTKPAPGAAAKPGAGPASDAPAEAVAVTKKELFTRVKARADGVKGRDVRRVMDALLNELGTALVAGETVKVPALGTLKVQKHKPLAGADVVVCKLRRKKPGARAKDPLAKPAEES